MAEETTEDKGSKKKFLGKYDSMEEAEKGHAELVKKLGEQGQALGDLKAQNDQVVAWAQQVAPAVQWLQGNAEWVSTLAPHKDRLLAAVKGQPTAPNPQPQAVAMAQAQIPGFEFLTPEQQHQAVAAITQHFAQHTFGPWTQQFVQAAQQELAKVGLNLGAQQRAATDVLWRTIEQIVPDDKRAFIKQWHEQSLKFSDPGKIDPMALAQDYLGISTERDTLKAELAKMKTEVEERAKAAVPGLYGGPPPSVASAYKPEEVEALKDPAERFRRATTMTTDAVGREAVRDHLGVPSV